MCHASKERVLLFGTDQRITSGPAATTAAFKGRIHGCTRTIRGNVRFFSCTAGAVHTWHSMSFSHIAQIWSRSVTRALPPCDGRVGPALAGGAEGGESQLVILNAGNVLDDLIAADVREVEFNSIWSFGNGQ